MTKFENSWGIYAGEGLARKEPKPIGAKPPVWIPQLFSNLVIIHLLTYKVGADRVFRNVGI